MIVIPVLLLALSHSSARCVVGNYCHVLHSLSLTVWICHILEGETGWLTDSTMLTCYSAHSNNRISTLWWIKENAKSLWRCIKHKLLFYSLHFGVNVCARCHYYSFKNVSIKRICFVISSLSTLSAMFPSRVCSLIRFLPCSAGFAVSVCGRIYSECWVWWNLFLTSLIRLAYQ